SVEFENKNAETIHFKLFDVQGKEVKTLLSEYIKPGKQRFSFTLNPLPSGIYFLKIFSDEELYGTQKLVRQ
ncbi:MAG TPA: T9SS type A sorting domain-containing protein, partial [Bacteroidia bacterium]|nr:T9SS type A sorting domain-containing protein [Bacteroidia bacterium]